MTCRPFDVWEMAWTDFYGNESPNTEIYLLIRKLPKQPGSARFPPNSHTWDVLVLSGDRDVGCFTQRQLDEVDDIVGDVGYDSYENEWRRLWHQF